MVLFFKQKETNENQALGETSVEGAKDWRASVGLCPIQVPGGKQHGGAVQEQLGTEEWHLGYEG